MSPASGHWAPAYARFLFHYYRNPKLAVGYNAPAIIVAHCHPSGDPEPSADDIYVTRQLVEAGRLLDIEVLDHVIIGADGYASLREKGVGFS